MKICSDCKTEKPLEDFSKNKGRKDGLSGNCKVCASARRRDYYERNRDKELAAIKARDLIRFERNKEFLLDYLKSNPCVDCGYSDVRALEFDHVRGTKVNEVGKLIRFCYSLKRIKEEIAKCEVRCSNCHRIATMTRGNHYRALWDMPD